jgi:hypothetical protein
MSGRRLNQLAHLRDAAANTVIDDLSSFAAQASAGNEPRAFFIVASA